MKVAGIIAEFNPFHNGHRYLVDRVRNELGTDCIAVVMSGNFVQRGEPALWDKWTRAACAVQNGVDLVLELPVCFALNSGESFARGGIAILKGLGAVTHLAFGSESADLTALERAAKSLANESAEFTRHLKDALATGMSYPAAYEQAARRHPELDDSSVEALLGGPNDILALEYMKQAYLQEAEFAFFPVRRIGAGHDAPGGGTLASASSIRQRILGGQPFSEWSSAVPQASAAVLMDSVRLDRAAADRYATIVRYAVCTKSAADIEQLISVSEGLENRIKAAAMKATSLEEFIASIKTKRYTHARISRILAQLVLGLDRPLLERVVEEQAYYARVLALNRRGAQLLRDVQEGSARMPVYANLKQAADAPETVASSLAWDCAASDLYSILAGRSVYEGSDYVVTPRLIDR